MKPVQSKTDVLPQIHFDSMQKKGGGSTWGDNKENLPGFGSFLHCPVTGDLEHFLDSLLLLTPCNLPNESLVCACGKELASGRGKGAWRRNQELASARL